MASISNPEPNVLVLAGEIDLHESPQVREALAPLIEKKTQRLLIDLSGVTYMDSSGLAVFVDAMQRMQSFGGQLAMFGLRENVRSIFKIARLDQVFKIFPDKNAAMQM